VSASVSVVIICYNRKKELEECIFSILRQSVLPFEIIVVDNNSSDGTDQLFLQGAFKDLSFIIYEKLETNLGVAGGRNHAIRRASGDILLFLDDDAEISGDFAIQNVVARFAARPDVGVVAFKIINFFSRTITKNEFPHIKLNNIDTEFETSYYVGAGHAIRSVVFDVCGYYPEHFFYGLEELDLSVRIIDREFKILYDPAISIFHKKSTSGRLPNHQALSYTFRNRLLISHKYFSKFNLLILSILWFAKIALVSRSVITPLRGIVEFIQALPHERKYTLGPETVSRLKQLQGRIWY